MTGFGIGPLLSGAAVTLGLSALGIAFGLSLGLVLAILRWRDIPVVGRLLAFYVSVVRATPLLTLALVVYFVTPALGYDIPAIFAAIMALTVNTSAFNCEIWRAGLDNFPRDQLDAARAAGMPRGLLLRRIMLPQIARASLPALVNEMTVLIKTSPAVSVIGIVDLTRAAVRIGADTYQPLPPLIVALVLYVGLLFAIVSLQRHLERRLNARYA
ncbi:MAG: hypothetical protein QOH33_1251 [Paraburkholderia sp.]|jgi:His/Glu/Gln/Arg/opine family amino acid ABC transporter permease subunit|nr:hypothetical protein [Paraburkholderia sp.]